VHLPATHYARAALEDSYQLSVSGHLGYWTDLVYALSNLKYPAVLPALPYLTPEGCVTLGKAVYTSAMKHLEAEVSTSTRRYMLHDRREPLDNESPRKITVKLRHYLELVENVRHRKALRCLLVSQHPLAVERMRYKQRYHRVTVPRDRRLCRFGCNTTETMEHALFFCRNSAKLEDYRQFFTQSMQSMEPRISSVAPCNATGILKSIILHRDTVCQVTKFVYRMLAVFDEEPMVWPGGM
jgi:hypothetical protein